MKKLFLFTLLTLVMSTSITQAADEGIKVHGHWTFKIYNADGSFDRKVEFDNALEPSGATFLLNVLVGGATFNNYWQINIFGSNNTNLPCVDSNGSAQACALASGSGTNTSNVFYGLTYQLDNTTNPTKLLLAGTFTVTNGSATDIGSVETQFYQCQNTSGTQPQSDCSGAGDSSSSDVFTSKTLSTPVAVSSGQVVQVTVEISFS